jgi:hypothetical protein
MADDPTPQARSSEVLKEPLFVLLKRLTAGEWAFLVAFLGGVGTAGYRLYPYLHPPKPFPEVTCPTSETIDRDCRGLQENGTLKVNAHRCLQLATDAQVCGKPDLVLSLLDLSCQSGNSEACREFNLIHPGPAPCDSPPQKSSHSSRQAPPPQAPVPAPLTSPPQTGRRHLDDAEKRKLTQELAKWPGKTFDVIVTGGGDREALFYGREIAKWMKQAGYPVKNGGDDLDTTTGSQLVGESVHLNSYDGVVWVEIGFRPESQD